MLVSALCLFAAGSEPHTPPQPVACTGPTVPVPATSLACATPPTKAPHRDKTAELLLSASACSCAVELLFTHLLFLWQGERDWAAPCPPAVSDATQLRVEAQLSVSSAAVGGVQLLWRRREGTLAVNTEGPAQLRVQPGPTRVQFTALSQWGEMPKATG